VTNIKKNIIKVLIWTLKHTCLVKNRLTFNFSKLSVWKGLLMQDWVCRLRLWTKRWKNGTKKSLTLNFKVNNQLPKFYCGPHRRCAAAFFFKVLSRRQSLIWFWFCKQCGEKIFGGAFVELKMRTFRLFLYLSVEQYDERK